MKRCSKCGKSEPQVRFANDKAANHSTYCIPCQGIVRQSGNKAQQALNNKLIRKGLKP